MLFTWLIFFKISFCIMLYLVIKSFSADLRNHFKEKWCIKTPPESHLLLFVFIYLFHTTFWMMPFIANFFQFEILKIVIIFWIWNPFTYIANLRCATKTSTCFFLQGLHKADVKYVCQTLQAAVRNHVMANWRAMHQL